VFPLPIPTLPNPGATCGSMVGVTGRDARHVEGPLCKRPRKSTPAATTRSTPPGLENVEHTCPMHPEVIQVGPGQCPDCGMALEPIEITADESNPELDDMSRRLGFALGLTIPVFVIAMSEMIPGRPLQAAVPPRVLIWIQLLLTAPVVLWCGRPFFERGWASVKNRRGNMFTLIAAGTGVSGATAVPSGSTSRRPR